MCKTKTIASKKHFFHQIIIFFVGPLKVPWRSRTLRPLGDLQGTSPGRRVPAGKKSKDNMSFLYWKCIIDLEIKVLLYVCSICEGNFKLHVEVLYK